MLLTGGCGRREAPVFPVQPGSVWTYASVVDGKSLTTEASITSSSREGGRTKAVMRWTENGLALQEETYLVSESEVLRARSGAAGAESYDPPLPALKLPLTVGKRWTWLGRMGFAGQSLPASAVVHVTGQERIKVAAGEFDAYRVGMSFEISSPTIKNSRQRNSATVWYAPGAGIVKQFVDQTSPDGQTRESSRELVRYKHND